MKAETPKYASLAHIPVKKLLSISYGCCNFVSQGFRNSSLVPKQSRWSFDNVLLIDTQKGKLGLPQFQAPMEYNFTWPSWRLSFFSMRFTFFSHVQILPRL